MMIGVCAEVTFYPGPCPPPLQNPPKLNIYTKYNNNLDKW
jgi:hypothetical protein